jgi:GT2 family glycosyltransferase
MSVSVLVPTFNRANYIAECLDSLLAQTMPAVEIVVIDDGSEDGTAELLQSYGERIRYIRKENGGKPTAVNLGLSLAQGDLIWIFDDDDVALPTAIADRVQTLRAQPDAGFVFSPHYYGHDDANGKIQRGRLHQMPAFNPVAFFFELMKGCFFHLATALVRVEVYRTVGGFDTELLSSEDYDMQLRLAQAYPAAYCPEPTFIFRQHTGLRGAKTIRYQGEDRTRVFRKFDERVGQKLRANLPLGDYLVPRSPNATTPASRRPALLARLTVMASKGCLPEMMEDLQSLLALIPLNATLEAHELETLSAAICTGYAADAIEHQWKEFKRLLATLPNTPAGRSAIRSVAVGLIKLAKGYPGSLATRFQRVKSASIIAIQSFQD